MNGFRNSWDDAQVSAAYSMIGFTNTYYLAYRDLPEIISRHITGNMALDFGCGAARSTRFLKGLGFLVTGVDISVHMLAEALRADPSGDYRLVTEEDPVIAGEGIYDLVLAVFTFDNIPGWEKRSALLRSLSKLLAPGGRIICLDSTPEVYTHEWASFTTSCFPENWHAKTGDIVRDIVLDSENKTVCEDILWTDSDYRQLFRMSGLKPEATYRPLGTKDEPFSWVSETTIAPWVIYVLKQG